MYTERDMNEINARIRKNWLVLAPVLALLFGVYVWALASARQWLAMVAGPLLFVAACYGILAYIRPNVRYRRFLRDMQDGLSRELRGTIVEVSDDARPQDGAMVLTVRFRPDEADEPGLTRHGSIAAERLSLQSMDDTRDERLLYLNASKREMLPEAGTPVKLTCFGRHIRSAEAL